MNEINLAQQDWALARSEGLTLALVVEQGQLAPEQRLLLADGPPIWPLMNQPQIGHLRAEGPALLDLSNQTFGQQQALGQSLDACAMHGWLSSPLAIAELTQHLGDALACRDSRGEVLLIRSYARTVLPKLHARQDLPWHAWLFGPLTCCWLPQARGWQRLAGNGLRTAPGFQPIELDESLEQALGRDPHARALLAQLQAEAPEVFASTCHDKRLAQVESTLTLAREAGLQSTADQSYFTLYSLLEGQPMQQRKDWPEIRQLVEQQGHGLAQAQHMVEERTQP
ncbi:conserved hypothetical protein [Pseudomonas sp. 8AS]|uniref:DUF4123 domain-containing protein n=1 Tax=Pseudomonas sp. 8AS TaxID=2653163 RepID=UPI0012EF350B|nr:DUF4123 domain-containing protein [Pseudomonas sp. 8AS]VXC25788.1 conserved hypothetical protein [Pseudomonas sp. 8AS]